MACSDRREVAVGDPGAGDFAGLGIMEHLMRRLQLVGMDFLGMVVVMMFVVIVVVTLGHDVIVIRSDGCPIENAGHG
jgi:hypothetical protein